MMASRGTSHVRDDLGFLVENPPANSRTPSTPAAAGQEPAKATDLRPVAYRFPPDLIERLRRAAYELRTPQSELVRQAVDQHLTAQGF